MIFDPEQQRDSGYHLPMIMRTALLFLLVALTACGSCRPSQEPGGEPPPTNTNAPAELVDTSKEIPYDFQAVDFVDLSKGWIVGIDEGNNVSAILMTTNGGAAWSLTAEIVGDTLLDVDFVDEKTGWAVGTEGVIYGTTDGGKTWAPEPLSSWQVRYTRAPLKLKAQGEQNVAPEINASIASMFALGDKAAWAAGDVPTGEGLDVKGFALGSKDGGAVWAELVDAAGKGAPYSVNDLWFTSETDGWAAAGTLEDHQEDVLLHTTDGGKTWERRPTGTAQYLRAIQFASTQIGWLVGITSVNDDEERGPSKILTTTDGGATWTVQFNAPRSFYDVCFVDPRDGWVVGDRASVYQTVDGGKRWRQQTRFDKAGVKRMQPPKPTPGAELPRALRTIYVRDAAHVFVAGDGVIMQRK